MGRLIVLTLLGILTVTPVSAQSDSYLASPNGTYLGKLGNRTDPNSIRNPYGSYGSPYAPNSINNPYGRYGSRYSQESPNNPYATQQPYLVNPSTGSTTRFGGSPYNR